MGKIKRFGKYLVIAIMGFLLFILGKYLFFWNSIEVAPDLSKKALFRDFTHQKQQYIDGGDSDEIKTNNFQVKIDSLSTESYGYYITDHPLSLEIRIVTGDGYSGGGYSIEIIGNRYRVSPYHYTDSPRFFDFINEDYYKIINNKVILNKDSYKKGDSIFGYTELKIQKRYGPEKYFVEGKGYFKGVVN